MAVEHPVDRHLVAGPTECGEGFELCPGRLVVRELRLAGELLGPAGPAVAPIDHALNARQRGIAGIRSGVEGPGVVDGPQLVGRDELGEARIGRDVFVVALLGRGASSCAIATGEPVRRRPPGIGPGHLDAVPHPLPVGGAGVGRHGVDHRVLPMQVAQDGAVLLQHRRWRVAVAGVGPDEGRGM